MPWQPWKVDRAPAGDVADDGDAIHVRPRNDRRWHPLDERCWCQPKVEDLTDHDRYLALLVMHNAADGRDAPGPVVGWNAGPTAFWKASDDDGEG